MGIITGLFIMRFINTLLKINTSLQVASAKIGFLIPIFCYAKVHPLNTTRERPYFHDVGCQSHLLYNR